MPRKHELFVKVPQEKHHDSPGHKYIDSGSVPTPAKPLQNPSILLAQTFIFVAEDGIHTQ